MNKQLGLSAVSYLKHWIGTPYIWGGQDFSGFDCSGIIHEVLQAYGIEKRGFDSTAHELYLIHKDKIINQSYNIPHPGCLVFWFNNGKAIHVEMVSEVIGGNVFVIGASGGGSDVTTTEKASKKNAYIKQNIIGYRGINFKIVDPFLRTSP